MSGRIWFQTVCNIDQQTALVGIELIHQFMGQHMIFLRLMLLRSHSFNVHAQLSSRFICLSFCLVIPFLPYFVHASSEGSSKTVKMRMLARAFYNCICDKYQTNMIWLLYCFLNGNF